ncbi:Nuclear hormone receptor family member nhr-54 [Caenorhabditis elegans]|uniref:Nuclear hormone receptor family member nhr-54 n=1 Tax=Caenorhabditis elegans TaxID=6239 RepID=NHR54_CAEEL|nr:Nuclear hormone receptor family member nhr-54 [Caenorhabditis elegans]O45460.1 RecName: Full=Nuclear hormone receptor family member nhr-54 [Caenorhabditis elegans]CAB04316.1 Nuclear hormone receptor family member nhr-54 [Caenorhabditis elegans]|eukprot:NP_507179.3 Nuclear hormone receptor family member nhr-54 [Caenorhabditis elegans]
MEIPSTSSEMTYFSVKCAICYKAGHGQHFGVETCRACAAFFRRTVVLNRKYKCTRKSGKCKIGSDETKDVMCKFCRFKKCIDLGMTTENVRTDQVINLNVEPSTSQSLVRLEMTSLQPETDDSNRVQYQIIHPRTRGPAILIDVNAIIKRSKTILETHFFPDDDVIVELNPLEKMTFCLRKLRSKQSWNPNFFTKINFLDLFEFWESQMEDTATWLMYSGEFRKLPNHEKIAIFKIVWAVWRRLERYTMTAQVFGQKCYDEQILLHSHQDAARFTDYDVDYSYITDQGFEKINGLFGGKMIQYFDIIVKPYLELELSDTEIAYILCQIVWNYAGRRLQGQTQAAGERFLEVISNNLHKYYEDKSGNRKRAEDKQNYVARLAKMMQIVNQMLNAQLKMENTMDVAMLFNTFNIVFTEPEFFRV